MGEDNFKKALKIIKLENNLKKQKEDALPLCICGSADAYIDCCGNKERLLENKAILDDKFGIDFYQMLILFMKIINDELEVFAVSDYNTFFKELSNEHYIELKQLMLDNISEIIFQPQSLDAKMSDNDFQIYRGLKNHYSNNFIALEYIDQKLVLYDDDLQVKFLVSGITSPLSESVPFSDLPVLVNTTLIPLDNVIIYDVFINKDYKQFDIELAKRIINETKDLDICHNYESFIEHVGSIFESIDDDFMFSKIEHKDLYKTINNMKVKLIRLNEDTIGNYSNIWLEVLQSMRGVRSFSQAREVLKTFKDNFIDVSKLTTVLDYQPLVRVFEVDEKVIGFVSGILSYFESGIMFQIGTFGIASKYRKKGYGKIFFELLKEDMKEYNVNYLWLLPQNDGFWFKQGFSLNLDLMHSLYSLAKTDKPLVLKISDKSIDFKTFLEMFYDANGDDIPSYRSERSFK